MVSTTLTTIAAAPGQTTSGINNLHSTASSASPERRYHNTNASANNAIANTSTSNASEATNRSLYYQANRTSSSSGQNTSSTTSPNNKANLRSYYYNSSNRLNANNDGHNKLNGNDSDNTADYQQQNHSLTFYQREQQQQQLHHHQKYLLNGKVNGETTKTDTANNAATTLDLSQALVSSSSPISDQISLLFPKCRPKSAVSQHQQPHHNQSSVSPSSSLDQPTIDANSNCDKEDQLSNSKAQKHHSSKVPLGQTNNKSESAENKDKTSHYYRSVNIITQSPPPHSASSLSSESLSSVTPRISTNPFLCNQLLAPEEAEEPQNSHRNLIEDDDDHKLRQPNDHNEDDELPVPITAPFYYHTNTTSPKTNTPREKTQRQHNDTETREMPRKRSQYERYHHMNGQNYPNAEKSYSHGGPPEANPNPQQQQNGHPNQNPFVKDNYWENARQSAQQQSNNTPTSTVLNSPEYAGGNGGNGLPEMEHVRSQHRRSMYQQDQTGQQTPQQQQQQQHPTQNSSTAYMNTRQHIRLGRSPNSDSTSYSEATQKRNSYNSAQTQNVAPQHQNVATKSYGNSETTAGMKTLAQHYLYGSKTSLQDHGSAHSDWSEKRDAHERSTTLMREREREQREQRSKTERYINAALVRESVGEPNSPATLELRERRERDRQSYPQSQSQMQKYQQQQQQKSSHQYNHQQRSQQQQQIQQQQQQQQHNQSHRQLAEDRLSSTNEVIFDDITESWQNLRVTTDSSSQINQNRNSLYAGEVKTQHHHDAPSSNQMMAINTTTNTTGGGVGGGITSMSSSSSTHLLNSVVVPKKSHLAMTTTDAKDDKHQSHSQTHHVPTSVVVVNNSDLELSSSSNSFKDHKKYSEKNHGISVESRHGIIEYEGSPRRIGQMGNNSNDEDHHHQQQQHQQHRTNSSSNKIQGNATNKANHQRDGISSSNNTTTSTTVVAGATANMSNNSPKQHYTARPGFPQRIISPQRETTPPIMLLNYNGKSQQQQQQLQQQQQHHQQQQQLNSQQQSPTRDNNAEDTSNDVSEIGTISDLTTPEAIIHPAGPGMPTGNGNGIASICDSRATTSPSPPLLSTSNREMETAGASISASVTTTATAAPTATTSMTVSSKCSTPSTPPNTSATKMTSLNNIATAAVAASSSTSASGVNVSTAAPAPTTSSTLLPSNLVSSNPLTIPTKSSTFDYLYEFSETRKVLEEFFKCPSSDDKPIIENSSDVDSIDIQYEFHSNLNRGDIEEDEGDGDIEGDDDDDEIQLDGDNDEDIDNEDADDVETPQHHQPSVHLGQQHQLHQQQQQQQYSMQSQNNHHALNHHSSFRNHLQSPTQFTYRPYNEDEDDDDMDLDNEATRHNEMQHHYEQQQHHQQQQQLEQQENHHNFSLLNNRHASNSNSRQHNSRRHFTGSPLMRDFDFFLDSASRSSCEQIDQQIDGINHNQMNAANRQNYRYSPETTDYDSNCGDLDSLSGEMNGGVSTSCSNYAKYYASSMPVLEDGLSSGHTSDTENNNQNNLLNQQNSGIHHTPLGGGISMLMDMKRVSTNNSINSMNNTTISTTDGVVGGSISGGGSVVNDKRNSSMSPNLLHDSYLRKNDSPINGLMVDEGMRETSAITTTTLRTKNEIRDSREREIIGQSPNGISNNKVFKNIDPDLDSLYSISVFHRNDMVQMTPPPPAPAPHRKPNVLSAEPDILQPTPYRDVRSGGSPIKANNTSNTNTTTTTSALNNGSSSSSGGVAMQSNTSPTQQAAQSIKRTAQPQPPQQQQQQQQPPPLPERNAPARSPSPVMNSPVWLSRHLEVSSQKGLLESPSANHSKNLSADEDDVDTDLETDRLLGHQRLDDQGYYDENKTWDRKPARSLLSKISPKQVPSTKTRNGYNALLSSTPEIPPPVPPKNSSNKLLDIGGSMSSPEHSDKSPIKSIDIQDCGLTLGSPGGSEGSGCMKKDIDNGLGGGQATSGNSSTASGNIVNSGTGNAGGTGSSVGSTGSTTGEKKVKKSGAVLIEGVLFRAKYLGSTQLVCEGQPTKSTRMMQAEEAVSRIKAPDGDVQPSTEVDLFISTEKIMVLNTDLKEIMMDHALRTISYIADIGDLVVLMARRRFVPQDIDDAPKPNRTPKMICHVFESDEAQFIAQSIGQAFQVAYMEFLKANGIEDHRFVKEMDYQEVLNSQEIFGDELEIFAKKELQKEVVVPKAKGEILGVVIVESGWGSMLPTVVIANLMSSGAAARCGQLNIGDQLIAINGLSLVGLPLSTCQTYIKNTKNQTVVKFTVVPCPPVVEVKIKRPETKYQLGFSVQNGVICSLLRGGIAERGGVRVGHRIIEINNQSVVAVPHEKIVNLLATSVGEILMKTMPTSMFRLLTGQENPIYI